MKNKIRPTKFKEYIGQTGLKVTLKTMLSSAKKQNNQLDHILLYSKPGLGKTTLATVLANESRSKIRYAQGPALEKKSDILMLFGGINLGDFVFIDEIHGINKQIEELLYSIIEDFTIDITVGPDGDQKIVRVKLPPFTLIGATTKQNKLSRALRDRFGLIARLANYSDSEITKIIMQSSKNLNVNLENECANIIAKHSKQNPRLANNILKRVIDFGVASNKPITPKIIKKTFKAIGLYQWGLNDNHIHYLEILTTRFDNKYVSIETISGLMLEAKETIESEIEVDLLKHELIIKTTRGRKATSNAFKFMKEVNAKKD